MTDIPHITVAELSAGLSTIALVDVRNPDEFEQARVPGALLVPLVDLPDRLGDLPEGPLHLICRSGGRSLKACEFLAERGHTVFNVAGGTLAWIEAGHPVDDGPEES